MHNRSGKDLLWLGSSKLDWASFPQPVRQVGGYQPDKIQRGEEPSDWKAMPTIGAGVRELRIRDTSGAFRVVYLATRPEGVYVLHAFRKKTRKTSQHDLRLARDRFRTIQE